MLRVSQLSVRYGSIVAVRDVSLEVAAGEIVAIIGSNGAGKTTTLRAVSGLLPVAGGRVELDGHDITGRPAHQVAREGLVQVPEGRQIFSEQSVEDNLLLGNYSRRRERRQLSGRLEREYARFPILAQRRQQLAGTLSGGEQQMLAISRALMSSPRVLMLDEPSMGLAPIVVSGIAETISELRGEGVTILLVEQMAMMALSLADRAYLLHTGTVLLQGSASDIINSPALAGAYLGKATAHGDNAKGSTAIDQSTMPPAP